MAEIIDISKIVAEFGKYYVKEGQGYDRIRTSVMQMPVTLEKNATHIRTTETLYKMTNPAFKSVIQPFKPVFNPVGGAAFHPNKIELQKIKADVPLTPDDIEDSFLGFLADLDQAERKNWPVVRWMIEKYILPQANEDRELETVYLGKRNEDGQTPKDCMDGIKVKLMEGAESSYPINIIEDIEALDPDTAFEQIEAFDKKLPNKLQSVPMRIYVAPEMIRSYLENKRGKGYYMISSDKEISNAIDFTLGNHVIVGLPSMAGTKDMFATVPGNLLWCSNRRPSEFRLDIQAHYYEVAIMMNWREGVGFGCNQLVFATEETVTETEPEPGQSQGEGSESGQQGGEGGNSGSEQTTEPETITVTEYASVDTEAATSVADTTATLNATVANLPEDAVVTFNYGTDPESLSSEAEGVAGEEGAYSAALTGLTAETKYYAQAVVTKDTHKWYGNLVSFTTTA